MNRNAAKGRWRAALVLAAGLSLLGLTLYGKMRPCCSSSPPGAADTGQALIQWIEDNGGTAGVAIRPVNDEGLMGTLATRAYKPGETIIALPEGLAVALLSLEYTAAEQTFALMALRHRHSAWWASMAPYWASLPAPGQALREQSFPDDLLALLQDEALAAHARTERAFAQQLYAGTAQRRYQQGSLAEEFPGLNVSLAEFMHWSTVLGSYCFAFPRPKDGQWMHYMLPLVGNINHAGQANTKLRWDHTAGAFLVVALRDIEQGEEVTYCYNHSLQRNDASLMKYGFIQRPDPPRVAGVDLPGGVLGDTYEGPMWEHRKGGPLGTPAELERLRRLLARFPTSAEEDAALLAGGGLADRWQRLFVEFRMLRKRALQRAIDTLLEFIN